jgi:hypothetical protein
MWRHALPYMALALFAGGAVHPAAAQDVVRTLGAIDIGAGEHAGDVTTVNGSINIGEGATLHSAHTTNGSISVQGRVSAGEFSTVNGAIRLDEGVQVSGDVRSVNGSLNLADGVNVAGRLTNTNGHIRVAGAHVGSGIETVGGSIDLGPNARIDGGIHVGRPGGTYHENRPPRVIVGPGSIVKGTLHFERPVRLYVSDQATIGPVEGATANHYSGAEPPPSDE